MGRPINKKFLGDVEDSIKVSHYFRVGESETAGEDDTYIVSQRSTNKFLVADTSGGWQEVLTLVDKDAGSLAEGEFRIDATSPDGEAANVARLYNRTVRLSGNEKAVWSTTSNAAVELAITGVTQANPAVVSYGLTQIQPQTGDTITIDGIVGMTELNGRSFTITSINGTSFSLDGEDSTGHTAYGSGGTITGLGSTGSIDTQAT